MPAPADCVTRRTVAVELRLGDSARLAPERAREEETDRKGKQPPRVDVLVGEQGRQPERNCEARCDAQVVADDEVPPEESEGPDVAHAGASIGATASRRRRSTRTNMNEAAPRNASTPSSESSSPGQSTPAPSAPQKQPKVVSSRPTTNLIVFSGTRSSGPRAKTPAPITSTNAAAAPAEASPIRPWALPNEITMKTTSSPSSRTPLKATVNEYQSSPALSSRRAAAACSRCRRKAASSSLCDTNPLERRIAFRSHCSPKARRSAPTTSRSVPIGTTRSAGPSAATSVASTTVAAPTPISVERQPRTMPTPRTIVSASTISTALARKAPTIRRTVLVLTQPIVTVQIGVCWTTTARRFIIAG